MKQEKFEKKRRDNFMKGRNASSAMSSVGEIQIKSSNKVIENTILSNVHE